MNLKLLKNDQHDYGTCVHLYMSSDVAARFQDVFQNDFNNKLGEPDCYAHIKVESDTGFHPQYFDLNISRYYKKN